MGTVADKLNYLNTTKQKIKTVMNAAGCEIDDTTTFRNYATVLNNQIKNIINNDLDLFDLYPSVSDSGTNVTLEGTDNTKLKLTLNPTELTQSGTPSPESPVDVNVIKGNNTITISNSDNTQSQNYSINLGDLEYGKIGNYEDEIIETTGKNLFDKDNATYLDNANVSSSSVINIENNFALIYLKLKAGTYNISNDIGSYQWLISDCEDIPVFGESTSPRQVVTETNTTYTLSSERYLLIRVAKSTISINDFIQKLQITEGEEMLPYEPYGANEWYLKENVGKVVLDGSETYTSIWFYPDAPRFGVSTELPNALTTSSASQFIQMYSNRFLSQKQEDLWTAGLYSDGICMRANNAQLIIKNNDISTPATSTEMINDFKNWISTHNIKVYYPMTSPIFTQITDTTLIGQLENIRNNARTYEGQTNITQTNTSLPFDLEITALKKIDI